MMLEMDEYLGRTSRKPKVYKRVDHDSCWSSRRSREDGIELTSSPLLLRWIPEVKHNTGQRSPL